MTSGISAFLAGSCLFTIAGAMQPALAQTTPEQAGSAVEGVEASEIIVTAQRRSESLQRTPVAVAVLSADTLAKRAVTTESDLQIVSPGLTVRASQNSNQINYAIRGQSLDAFSGTRPGVLPYVNEVQVGGNAGASAFYDLQSIQVLKGPQGTLFGRNATGGAVLFTTQRPKSEFSGYMMGRVGDYDLRQIEGAINVPLVEDQLLARVAGFYQKRDGFQEDLYQGSRAGNVDRYGFRVSLTISPVSWFKNDLMVDYYHAGGNSLVGPLHSLNANGAIPLIALTNFGNQAQFDAIIGAFIGNPAAAVGSAAQYAAANPRLDPGGLASFLARQKARGPYQVETNGRNAYRGRSTIVSNITSIDLGPDTQLRNVIGHTDVFSANSGDIDGTPYGIDDSGTLTYKTRQFSEELQLVGKVLGNRLSYVTGVYYSSERSDYFNTGLILTFPIIAGIQSYAGRNENKTYAGYLQGTYDLSDTVGVEGLGITGGVRYTSEKVSYQTLPSDISFTDPPAVQATYDFDQSTTYKNWSWTLGIQEQLSPSTLLYVASRRSYRNGGYNNSARPKAGLGTQGGNRYGTERVTDLEVGAKYGGRLGGIPVRANIALYQNWINDSQRVAYTLIGGSPAGVTVNVPRAKVKGVEFDTQIDATSWLQLGGSVNYTDAKFTRNLVSIAGSAPVRLGTYPDTAKWSGSAFAEVSAPVTASLTASLRGDVYAQTSTYFTSSGNNNPGSQTPGYAVANFRVGVEDKTIGWSLSANLKNAFNRTYYVGGIGLGELFQLNTIVPGEPRTFLVEARYQF
jgi:iron complex outermembrane receptor protein